MDDINDLKELVSAALEKKKVLSRLRAELRAHVFLIIDEEELASGGEGLALKTTTPQREALLKVPDGRLALQLVHEFLEWCSMEFTLRVLEPETGESIDYHPAPELRTQLGLGSASDTPVLVSLLQHHSARGSSPAATHQPPPPTATTATATARTAPAARAAAPPLPSQQPVAAPAVTPAVTPATAPAAATAAAAPPAPAPPPLASKLVLGPASRPGGSVGSPSQSMDDLTAEDSATSTSTGLPSKLSPLGGAPKLQPLGARGMPPLAPLVKSPGAPVSPPLGSPQAIIDKPTASAPASAPSAAPKPGDKPLAAPTPAVAQAAPAAQAKALTPGNVAAKTPPSAPVQPDRTVQQEASAGSDESYSDDVEEEIASDASLEEDLDAVDGDGEEEDYATAVTGKPAQPAQPQAQAEDAPLTGKPSAPAPASAPVTGATPLAPLGRPPLPGGPLGGLPPLKGMPPLAPLPGSAAAAAAAAAGEGGPGVGMDLSESNLSTSSFTPGRIRPGRAGRSQELGRSGSIEQPGALGGGDLSLSRELLAGDRSFASSRELGGGGLSFDDPDDRGGLTMSGELPRGGLSGMSVGMSVEVPRGGLSALGAEPPKAVAAAAPSASTEIELSPTAGTSAELPAPKPRGLAPLAPLGKPLAPLGGGGPAPLAPPAIAGRPLRASGDDIKEQLRRQGLLTTTSDSLNTSMDDTTSPAAAGAGPAGAGPAGAGPAGALGSTSGLSPTSEAASPPALSPSSRSAVGLRGLRPLATSRPPPGPSMPPPAPSSGAGIYDAEFSVSNSMLEDVVGAGPGGSSGGGAGGPPPMAEPSSARSGAVESARSLDVNREFRHEFGQSMDMRDPVISPSDRSGDIENLFGSADIAETAEWD